MRLVLVGILSLGLIGLPSAADTIEQLRLLSGPLTSVDERGRNVLELLKPPGEWRPFPDIDDREAWESLPEDIKAQRIEAGENALDFDWPTLTATLSLKFEREGDRSSYSRAHSRRRSMLADLVLAECIENEGRFVDQIMNGIWAISEQTFWNTPQHLYLQQEGYGLADITEPTVDLHAGMMLNLLAWTDYLVGPRLDDISPLIRERIRVEADRRIFTPLLDRDDFWWMGFDHRRERVNNWNPWINSNWLVGVLLLEEDERRRAHAVYKILRSLDEFIDPHPRDGGCDEGPGYWNHAAGSLFDSLDMLYSATDGGIDVFEEPVIKRMGQYVYKAHIRDDFFINFGDASPKPNVSADLIYRYGARLGDERMQQFAAFLDETGRSRSYIGSDLTRTLHFLFRVDEFDAPAEQPYARDMWLPDTEHVAARSVDGSPEGLYFAAKAGHNGESHNHNNVGNYMVFVDGYPALVDAGVEAYTGDTFHPERRWELWTMQSGYHNLPTINGVMQRNGLQFRARDIKYEADDDSVTFALDIAGAYPDEAHVDEWRRTIHFERGDYIEVSEAYRLSDVTDELKLTLMTPCNVDASEPGRLRLTGEKPDGGPYGIEVAYDADRFSVRTEEVELEPGGRLERAWEQSHLTRILLYNPGPPAEDAFSVRITEIAE